MRRASWIALDWATATYATFVAVLVLVRSAAIPGWPYLVLSHAVLVGAMLALPARGAAWERSRPGEPPARARLRAVARFLRYTYPALLLTPFFEEVSLTVNAVAPQSPYWFEPSLYAADRALFGAPAAVLLSQPGGAVLDEIMHAFYFSYYLLIIGGIVVAWVVSTRGRETPTPGFHTAMTCMMLGFFFAYVWYPFLPARGPWENGELMAGLRPFSGWVFTRAIDLIIASAAVSGGCFPSAHVSGTWALTFGLFAVDPRRARWFAVAAVGLTIACVYTRYHHGVDVFAGFAAGAAGAMAGHWLTRQRKQDISAT